MFVLTIAAIIGLVVGLFFFVAYVQNKVVERFEYRPFTLFAFSAFVGSYFLLSIGYSWLLSTHTRGGDPLNGIVLMVFGAALLSWIVFRHIRRTSVPTGIGICVLQIPLFAALAYIGIFLLILFVALTIVMPAVLRGLNPPMVRLIQ
ncbi:hypothetical protein [Sphingomonas sp. 22176]|uniref:hypothetical protein n=1 Tax=Sphingomonas sp. 22176 TaxID=3453884 RepID=UPI003F8527A0